MSCYWFYRQKLLQKAKDIYHNYGGKKKADESCLENRGVLKKVKNMCKGLSKEEKEAKRKSGKNRYRKMKENAS